jgi:hypothetical protein
MSSPTADVVLGGWGPAGGWPSAGLVAGGVACFASHLAADALDRTASHCVDGAHCVDARLMALATLCFLASAVLLVVRAGRLGGAAATGSPGTLAAVVAGALSAASVGIFPTFPPTSTERTVVMTTGRTLFLVAAWAVALALTEAAARAGPRVPASSGGPRPASPMIHTTRHQTNVGGVTPADILADAQNIAAAGSHVSREVAATIADAGAFLAASPRRSAAPAAGGAAGGADEGAAGGADEGGAASGVDEGAAGGADESAAGESAATFARTTAATRSPAAAAAGIRSASSLAHMSGEELMDLMARALQERMQAGAREDGEEEEEAAETRPARRGSRMARAARGSNSRSSSVNRRR